MESQGRVLRRTAHKKSRMLVKHPAFVSIHMPRGGAACGRAGVHFAKSEVPHVPGRQLPTRTLGNAQALLEELNLPPLASRSGNSRERKQSAHHPYNSASIDSPV